jgi:apolipoprotein N-acyltransferase
MKKFQIHYRFLVPVMFVLSALLLTVIQPPFNPSFLAWIAYTPFIIASILSSPGKNIFIWAYLIGILYWLFNLYWIALITVAGWLAFCAYIALLWPLLALSIRFCREKKIPLLIAVPVLIVGAENFQGFLLGGFYWRFLAHSQYANLPIIQIADIFGAAGISFLIAMVNALVAEFFLALRERLAASEVELAGGEPAEPKLSTSNLFLKIAIVVVAISATLFYGLFRLRQTPKFIETGPIVGSVQTDTPQSIKDSDSPEINESLFSAIIRDSNSAIQAAATLVVWPETMVPAILDERVLNLLDHNSPYIDFDRRIRQHAKDSSYILAGATGGRPKINEDKKTVSLASRLNSAFLYQPDGLQATHQYNKIHLVPFGEFVPFKKSFTPFYKLLMVFTPYKYDYSLEPGDEYTVFRINDRNGKDYTFSVMICYEDAVPDIARNFVRPKPGQIVFVRQRPKPVDWLINISNDGWFVRSVGNKVAPSTELSQHSAVCVFRAVENRISILRSVNTGISCLIDSTGQIKNGFLQGNLPINATERQGMAGWFVDKLPIDKRITFFSKYGRWLDLTCQALFALSILSIFTIKVRSRLKAKGRGNK